MRRPKLEVFKGQGGWFWRLKGGNGEIQCHSESYTYSKDAVRGAKDARRNMRWAKVVVE